MTEATTEGQMVAHRLTGEEEAALAHAAATGAVTVVDEDPLNAAIAATAGEVAPEELRPLVHHPMIQEIIDASDAAEPTPEQNAAALQAYIDEGVRHATGHFGSAEVVSVAAFREALGKLMEHLHLDHPENYLPK